MFTVRYMWLLVLCFYGYSLCQADPAQIFLSHIDNATNNLWTQLETDSDHVFLRSDLESFIHSYDTDNDTHVTRNEFYAHFLKDDPDLGSIAYGMFLEFDTNQDGLIDTKDLDSVYARIDINGDNRVEEAEFKQYFKSLLTILYLMHIQGIPDPGPIVI
ncbi:uncharacterized protein LOC132551088 [Ylistrum balloti]|uniref:uncharacterized protein LOC132551088 n=1 Tax=Ylistrum balloti TaxID=509963 RepID=UPI002905BDC7|nr:uncharacterized protein LOC132551088 [Ylistrum balloti]